MSLFSVKSKSRLWQKVKESCCCRLVFNTFSTYEYEKIRINYNKEQIGWVSSNRQRFQSKRSVCRRSVTVKFEQTLHAIPQSPHLLCAASCSFNSKITPCYFWDTFETLYFHFCWNCRMMQAVLCVGSAPEAASKQECDITAPIVFPGWSILQYVTGAFGRWHSWMALETALTGRTSQRRVSDDAWFPNLT